MFKDVFETAGVLATASNTITVNAAGTTTEVTATAATDIFVFTATSVDNFATINGLTIDDQINVIDADGTAAGDYNITAEDNAGNVDAENKWHFDGGTGVFTFWDNSENASAIITLTDVDGVTVDNNGVITITSTQ